MRAFAPCLTTHPTCSDNFYSHGIGTDEHDQRFKSTFENVFTADSLKADNYFRVVAGNHDHNGNVTAQIAYSAHSNRWSFPSLYYDFTETAPDGATGGSAAAAG